MKKEIPFKVLPIGSREAQAVKDVVMSRNIGMGKKVRELEERFAEYVGSKYAVAVDSCTSALFLSLKFRTLSNLGKLPVEVKIPSMTVPLVANTIIHAGGKIRFVDACDWVGHSYELEPYSIIDSAHKVSKDQYKGRDPIILICYSFYPTKPITSCEGGMIATNDRNAVDWIEKARFYGRNSGDTISKNSWEYDIEFPGWKMNMTEVQAAIALEQLKKLPEIDKKRTDVLNRYNKNLDEKNSSLYLYRIRVEHRDDFIRWMKLQGIECGVHFKPLHLMQAYEKAQRGSLVETELCGQQTVSLPSYDSLTMEQVDYVSDKVTEWRSK